jgi:DNA polymerase-3 subunit epsilon
MPLYVGKSVDVRERVMSHFAGDRRSGTTMRFCQQAVRVEAHPTYGELGALLLEAHLIKALRPFYNQRLRHRSRIVTIQRAAASRGYDRLQIRELERIPADGWGEILAICSSRQQAKRLLHEQARAHQLCPRLLGLERGAGACLSSQLQQCRGACRGAEGAALYNARLAAAFADRRITAWPFGGPVLVEERAPDGSGGHAFVFDGWRLLHALKYAEQGHEPLLPPDEAFDYDRYQILRPALQRRGMRVRPLQPHEYDLIMEGAQDGSQRITRRTPGRIAHHDRASGRRGAGRDAGRGMADLDERAVNVRLAL